MSRDGWAKKRANAMGDNGWAERGGYMAAKVSKLDEQFKLEAPREKQKDGSFSNIFNGVAIYVNGYTEPSADELRRLMMLHGGQFHVYYSRSKTTHIIANNLPNSKIQELKGEKIMRPEWITDSIKAGHLLPHLQYQLYSKQKGPLFPGTALRQTSETAGPSHGPLQPSVHQKLHLSSCHNNNNSNHNHNQANVQPQSSAARFINAQPAPLASTYLNADPRHRSSSHTHLLSHPGPTKPPHKPTQSTFQTPHTNVQHQRASQPQPHSNACCNSSGRKDVELHMNGLLQTSLDETSHSKANERDRGAPPPQVVKDGHLTNGHARLVNGALKPEDASPAADQPAAQCRVQGPDDPSPNPPVRSHTKLDPYEFPHSPPKRSDSSCPVTPKQSTDHRPKPPEAVKTTESHKQLPPSDSKSESASRPLSHTPVRLNGSHHNAFPSDATSVTAKPDISPLPPPLPSDKSPLPSKPSAAKLLAETGGLISEFYSHSRLHQISTWRSGFSEYVNELHSKRKAAGGASFPGKERLRRSGVQRCAESRGTSAPASVKSCILHVDMDCFFVSVGIRHRPELKGKPVAVTSNRGHGRVPLRPGAQPQLEQQYYQRKHDPAVLRGPADEDLYRTPSQESPDSHANGVNQDAATLSMAEIASCSYEARQAGVRNGMFFGKAMKLCPSLQSVPYDFEAYKEVALAMYETLAG